MNKKQTKEYNNWKSHLQISNPGEEFVLNHVLQRDWNRDIILMDIEQIKLERGLIRIKATTRSSVYDFSVSDINSKGWNEEMSQSDIESYVSGDLYHKLFR